MSRVATLLVLALVALALVPAAMAAQGDSIAIIGMPSAPVKTSGTEISIPFDVAVTVGQGNCAGGSAQDFVVKLKADLPGVAGKNVTVTVTPDQFTVSIGPGDTIQTAKTYTHSGATLKVTATGLTQALHLTANVTASADAVKCNVAPLAAGPFGPVTSSATVEFQPLDVGGSAGPTEQPVPGLEAPLLVLALLGIALVSRRK